MSTVEAKPFLPKDYLLEGGPPDPIHIPEGCSFQSRCPFVFDICRSVEPGLSVKAGGSAAACHLSAGDLPAPSIVPGARNGSRLQTAAP